MMQVKKRTFLKKLRQKKKLTQKEVAECININRTTYSQIESGKRNPGFRNADKIARFYELDIRKLL